MENVVNDATAVPPYVQRLIREFEENSERCEKLGLFILENSKFHELDQVDKQDLEEQHVHMERYLQVLGRRISRYLK